STMIGAKKICVMPPVIHFNGPTFLSKLRPTMLKPGDIVTTNFPGANVTKRRPGIVVSTTLYHDTRPDVIVGAVTTNLAQATSPSDYILQDWSAAGLHKPSAFRVYLITFEQSDIHLIGHLSDQDWNGIMNCLGQDVAVVGD